jgi:aminoglycoside phosphotransferase (APT) family kinase protein
MDTAALSERLRTFLYARGVASPQVVDLRPLTGGYSQLSYRFAVLSGADRHEYVLRTDRAASAALTRTDRRAEWEMLRFLAAAGARVPAPRWADLAGSELGAMSIISDYVEAQNVLEAARAGPFSGVELALRLAEAAAGVHAIGLSLLPKRFTAPIDWNAYVDGQIAGWRALEASHAERLPIIRYLAAWLCDHRPEPTDFTLVHGEFSLPNVLIDDAGATTVVDWEYAHIGDPRADLGWCLSRGMSEPPNLMADHLPQVCARYRELTGLTEQVVNPRSVLYFSMLGAARGWTQALGGIAAVARGTSDLLLSAFLISAWDKKCRAWMGQIEDLTPTLEVSL